MKEYLSLDEENEIVDSIENHSILVSTIMKFSNIFYDNKISKACVLTHHDGTFDMLINKEFWKTLNFYEKKFVICHELLHILYNHLNRMKNMANKENANIAADIVVNESLIKHFDFDRKYIRFEKHLCWIDTVFKKEDQEKDLKSFEQYYIKINSVDINQKKILDNHQIKNNSNSNKSEDLLEDSNISNSFYEKLSENIDNEIKSLDKEDLEKIKKEIKEVSRDDMIQDENIKNSKSNWSDHICNKVLKYEYKINLYPFFKKIITNWYQSFNKEKEEDQFIFTEPLLELVSKDLKIPSEYEIEEHEKNKNNLWVFMDVSGSCKDYIKDYVNVCMGIPKDKFNIRYFSFTTKVKEIKVKNNKIKLEDVWGGTNFNCIDEYIKESFEKNDKDLPDNVFVMTDGFAPKMNIKSILPEKWYFFITPNDNNYFTINIPKGVNIYNFKDIT